ncbi:FecR domain-containing protein [Polyangium aurulentum]|uniref:FecR domain-containing protein n=1 Tax=Polyangium aurulentum TaxID=2567896 RepID=UPI0010AE1D68|nr:FecR domain-containing protein [Polyangium aurulentum]UQA58153.1 FecR domain-containing protein [Polyangium aurulentum]
MSELRGPLRDRMRSPLNEAEVRRIWRAIDVRRARAVRRPSRIVHAGLALACAGLLALVLVLVRGRGDAGAGVCDGDREACVAAGPLTLAGGGEIGKLEAMPGALAPVRFELSDGSVIELSHGAKLVALESTRAAFSALLSEGRGHFHVKKGGPRRWSIECGLATVEVVGTRFVIDRSPGRVRVEVLEGAVLVRGERLPDRVRKLLPGESVDVDESGAHTEIVAPPLPTATARVEPPAAGSAVAPGGGAPVTRAARGSAWRERVGRGDHRGAYEILGAAGIERETAGGDVDALLLLADIARLSGHPGEAIAPLSKIVRERARDPRASLAAFTMGRLQLDSLGQPDRAARSFETSVSLGLGEPLLEDAMARLVEARARAGDKEGARAALTEYERRFPAGRRAREARRWAGEP